MKIRKAKIHDVEAILSLISYYAEKGLMLARPRLMLYENLREFAVIEDEGKIIGVGALHIIWEDLAEVRSLAVSDEYRGKGIGKKIVEHLIEEARDLGLQRVFTLTYQPVFFEKCGFKSIQKEVLTQKVWKECVNCPKFPNCDENALIIDLK